MNLNSYFKNDPNHLESVVIKNDVACFLLTRSIADIREAVDLAECVDTRQSNSILAMRAS